MRFFLSISFMLMTSLLLCQGENNIWLFDDSIHLDFNSGHLVYTKKANNIQKLEQGVATICDGQGNLLFYGNGKNLWNAKNENLVEEDLGGESSRTQGILVIQSSVDTNKYHIFTIGNPENDATLYHSIIRYSPNKTELLLHKEKLCEGITDKLIGIPDPCNGAWVLVHEKDNQTFLAFKLENDRVNKVPVRSVDGSYHTGDKENDRLASLGEMVYHPTTHSLSVVNPFGLFDLLKFDPTSGRVREHIRLTNTPGNFSTAFSRNGKYLYALENFYNADIGIYSDFVIQYDLTSWEELAIRNSRRVLGALDSTGNGQRAMKLGVDGKLYITCRHEHDALFVLNYPDERANFDGYYLEFDTDLGSNNFPQDLVKATRKDTVTFPDTTVCKNLTIDLSPHAIAAVWNKGDRIDIKGEPGLVRTFTEPGTYSVIYEKANGCDFIDKFTLSFYPQTVDTTYDEILDGQPYLWRDSAYILPGLYLQHALDENGCVGDFYLNLSEGKSKDYDIVAPNVFTPNGDLKNDEWRIFHNFGDQHRVLKLLVFDHWGSIVYQQKGDLPLGKISWDGVVNGQPAEAGIYTYYLVLSDDQNRTSTKSGSFYLLR